MCPTLRPRHHLSSSHSFQDAAHTSPKHHTNPYVLPQSSLPHTILSTEQTKMPSAKFTQTYEAVSKMGEKLKAAGKQGPSNDEQLHVRRYSFTSHCIL
jgi:hypothetical protein